MKRKAYIFYMLVMMIALPVTAQNPAYQHEGAVAASDIVDVQVTRTKSHTNTLTLGTTYQQYLFDGKGDKQAIAEGKVLLKGKLKFHNQHMMSFGVKSPRPTRDGPYDWGDLEYRMKLAKEMEAELIITFAAAPTWIIDPSWTSPDTDWSRLERAPHVDMEDEFAEVCAAVAAHFPEVIYFQVWNELKGMWNVESNRWDYERYTRLYNKVYDAVKAVRPDAKIGGPYSPMDSHGNPPGNSGSQLPPKPKLVSPLYGTVDGRPLDVVTYWLANKHGADFICIDGGTPTKDVGTTFESISATRKFYDITKWIKTQTDLPVWWSEDYIGHNPNRPIDISQEKACFAMMLLHHSAAGVSVSLRWSPEQQGGELHIMTSLFTSTRQAGGGKPLAAYAVYPQFAKYFPPGKDIYTCRVSDGTKIAVMASSQFMMAVNLTDQQQTVSVLNEHAGQGSRSSLQVSLGPYDVQFFDISGAMPVTLVSFSAEPSENKISLKWSTSWETQNDRFEIERSLDGKVFQSIGTVKAIGESLGGQDYSFMDGNPVAGRINYYRLKQIDFDGRYAFSVIRAARNEIGEGDRVVIAPNPVIGDYLKVIVGNSDNRKDLSIEIFDANGRTCQSETINFSDYGTINVRLARSLPNGIYIAFVRLGSYRKSFKFLLNRLGSDAR